MTKLPPFIARQERRRQIERLRAARRERELSAEESAHLHAIEWSHEAYVRLLDDIMALDPATRMLPSGVH